MIKEITETYFTNEFGRRFATKEEAEEDEKLQKFCPYKVKLIKREGSEPFNPVKSIRAIDDTKNPWTGQPNGTCEVFLLKDIIEEYQKLIDAHGDKVGWTEHHCGMGHYCKEYVILEDNLCKVPSSEPVNFVGYKEIKLT